jgi:hypothetical protein
VRADLGSDDLLIHRLGFRQLQQLLLKGIEVDRLGKKLGRPAFAATRRRSSSP